MKYSIYTVWLAFLFVSFNVSAQKTKNIILMIGDGMGFNHIEACNNYYGEKQAYEEWDSFRVSTYSKEGFYNSDSVSNDYTFVKKDYTDSGAAATALATGYKTFNGVIGLNENYYQVKNLSEFAEENGLSSGVVSSVPFCHATPAGFIAHLENRNFYHDLAVQLLTDSRVDVIIGCGNPLYDDNGKLRENALYKYIPKFLFDNIISGEIDFQDEAGNNYKLKSSDTDDIPDKWTYISSTDKLKEIAEGNLLPKRLFSMPEVYSTLQQCRTDEKFTENLPDLSIMSTAALNILDTNEKGFFLMIEGGAIDWASHDSSYIRAIQETYDFHKAVDAVIKWVEKNSNWDETLVIVTADHETGYLVNDSFSKHMEHKKSDSYNFEISSPNNIMGSVNGLQFLSEGDKYSKCNHSNQLVPLFVKGLYADKFTQKMNDYKSKNLNFDNISNSWYIDNTDIAKIIIKILEEE